MTLFLRMAQVMARNLNRPKINDLSRSVIDKFRVLPTDLDLYRHMNNARYLNYMEASRWGYQTRFGFLNLCLKNRWTAPIAKIEILYLKELKLLEQFSVETRLVKYDAKWFYIYQEFRDHRRVCAKALVKSVLRSRAGTVPIAKAIEQLRLDPKKVHAPESETGWLEKFSL
jgi:YbgC/YbaW family acyl-CoA thioester hydrolase